MQEQMQEQILPWVLSALTLLSTYLAGDLRRSAWIIGAGNQGLFAYWMFLTGNWGFAPMTGGLFLLFLRNYLLWTALDEDETP